MNTVNVDVQTAVVASYLNGVEDAVKEFAPEVSHECVENFMQTKLTEWNDAIAECDKRNKKAARKSMLITLGIAVGVMALPIVISAIGEHLERKEKKNTYGEY